MGGAAGIARSAPLESATVRPCQLTRTQQKSCWPFYSPESSGRKHVANEFTTATPRVAVQLCRHARRSFRSRPWRIARSTEIAAPANQAPRPFLRCESETDRMTQWVWRRGHVALSSAPYPVSPNGRKQVLGGAHPPPPGFHIRTLETLNCLDEGTCIVAVLAVENPVSGRGRSAESFQAAAPERIRTSDPA